MVNTPRGNRGRFVKASTSAAKAASNPRNSIKSYFSPVTPAQSPSLLTSPLTTGDRASTDYTNVEVPDSIGRPPTKLSLQPNDEIRETTNGVITIIDLESKDLESSPKAATKIIKHALEKVEEQSAASKTKESEKRTLRSKDGSSRVTSDLARFFADYEDVVFGPPKDPDFITPDTILFIVDKKSKTQILPIRQTPSADQEHTNHDEEEIVQGASVVAAVTTTSDLPNEIAHTRIDLSLFEQQAAAYTEDPLADSVYFKPHKRAERKEKQLRNIEKEHALHEKADLERILEDLQGSEWLRAMGITGASDMDKKRYSEHRDHFIGRVKALLSKFTAWKEQEKGLRIRKEEAQAAQEEEEEEEEAGDESAIESLDSSLSELDQSRSRPAVSLVKKITLRLTPKATPAPEPLKPFTSFYSKPHLREAALAGQGRGRSVTAFGLPLPEVHDQEFALPEGFISEEAIIANARKRRRLKRESHVEAHDG